MSEEDDAPEDAKRGERIAKWLARAGVASRRDAEKMIAELDDPYPTLFSAPRRRVSPVEEDSTQRVVD